MVSNRIAFDRVTIAGVLEEIARSPEPRRVNLTLEGAVHDLASEAVITVGHGRLIDVRAGGADGMRGLLRVALANSGEVTWSSGLLLPRPIESYPSLSTQMAEAQAAAAALEGILESSGGLLSVLTPNVTALAAQLGTMPDAATAIVRLIDGVRSVAAIMRDSPYDEVLSVRILQRLVADDLARPTHVPEPEPAPAPIEVVDEPSAFETAFSQPPDAVGSPDELEGRGVEKDVRQWLQDESIPEALLSDQSFTAAFMQSRPPAATAAKQAPVPKDTQESGDIEPVEADQVESVRSVWYKASDEPEPEETDDEPDLRGMDQAGLTPAPNRAILVGALIALAFVILLMSRRTSHDREEGSDEVPTSTVAAVKALPHAGTASAAIDTSTISRVVLTLREAPPIAGPDAPEEVRRAETLLSQGAYDEAGKLLDNLRARMPSDPAVWVLSGQHAVDSGGKLSVAGERAEKALAIDPKYYRAWVLKGSVQQFLGRRRQAAEAYERALKIDPNHVMSDELRTIIAGLGS